MTLVEHLYELRARLFKSAIAFTLAAIVGFVFFPRIFAFLIQPYCALPPHARGADVTGGCHLVAFNVFDQFNVRVKLACIVAAVVSSPVWLFQLWRFITPALHRKEKRYTLTFTGLASLLFFAGAVLSYLVLSKGLEFLLTVGGGSITTLLDVGSYMRYVVAMLMVFGIALEFPLLLIMLNFAGVLTYARMKSWWRGTVFGMFAFTAIATPSPSPFEMTALALVMCLLYGICLLVARAHDARKAKRVAQQERQLEAEMARIQAAEAAAARDSEPGGDGPPAGDGRSSDLSDIS